MDLCRVAINTPARAQWSGCRTVVGYDERSLGRDERQPLAGRSPWDYDRRKVSQASVAAVPKCCDGNARGLTGSAPSASPSFAPVTVLVPATTDSAARMLLRRSGAGWASGRAASRLLTYSRLATGVGRSEHERTSRAHAPQAQAPERKTFSAPLRARSR